MDSRRTPTGGRSARARAVRPATRASISACALALLAAVVVAGCGESSGSTTQSVAQSTQPTSTATTPTSLTPGSTATQPPASGAPHSTGTSTTPANPTTPGTSSPKRGVLGSKASAKAFNLLGLGKIALSSSAFNIGGPIATRYTCDGAGVSPQIQWHGVPNGAAELFLSAGDPGGGRDATVQWALAIPASASEVPAGSVPAGTVVGVNSAGKTGWGGVCGAKGKLQHVTFLFYALRHKIALQPGFTPAQSRSALKGNTLGTGFTIATYQR